MGDLSPVAFDIETSGLGPEAVVTVAGFAHGAGVSVILNADGQPVSETSLRAKLSDRLSVHVSVTVCPDEAGLLAAVSDLAARLDGDEQYLCAYNGETWNGGFDLPFLRTRCVAHDHDWPFSDLPYVDLFELVDRFDTGDASDLAGVSDVLLGTETCDPFEDSGAAVTAFERGDWVPLLLHNIADVRRTRALAVLAERYVAKSDFGMKNLDPPTD